MQCSNCGKDVPFAGNVCPYCHADKSKDQTTMVVGVPLALLGAAVGAGVFGLWGGVGGFVAGVVAGMSLAKKIHTPKK